MSPQVSVAEGGGPRPQTRQEHLELVAGAWGAGEGAAAYEEEV